MYFKNTAIPFLFGVMAFSCNQQNRPAQTPGTGSKEPTLFAKGEKITSDNFTGTAYLHSMIEADSLNPSSVGNVTFEPGARSKWHSHPAGQILLATGGVGYYQEKGQPKLILRKGGVIKCAPNTPHWHGASADTAFVQVAITGRQNGPTQWLEAVTDEEYNAK